MTEDLQTDSRLATLTLAIRDLFAPLSDRFGDSVVMMFDALRKPSQEICYFHILGGTSLSADEFTESVTEFSRQAIDLVPDHFGPEDASGCVISAMNDLFKNHLTIVLTRNRFESDDSTPAGESPLT